MRKFSSGARSLQNKIEKEFSIRGKVALVLVDSSFEPSTIGEHIAVRIPLNDVMPS
jgi:hypothetical protein